MFSLFVLSSIFFASFFNMLNWRPFRSIKCSANHFQPFHFEDELGRMRLHNILRPSSFFAGEIWGKNHISSPHKKVESSRSPIMMVVADIMGRHERRKERLFFPGTHQFLSQKRRFPLFPQLISRFFSLSLSLSLWRGPTRD